MSDDVAPTRFSVYRRIQSTLEDGLMHLVDAVPVPLCSGWEFFAEIENREYSGSAFRNFLNQCYCLPSFPSAKIGSFVSSTLLCSKGHIKGTFYMPLVCSVIAMGGKSSCSSFTVS